MAVLQNSFSSKALRLRHAAERGNLLREFVSARVCLHGERSLTLPPSPSPRPGGERAGVRGFEPETIAPPRPNPVVIYFPPRLGPRLLWGRRGKKGAVPGCVLHECMAASNIQHSTSNSQHPIVSAAQHLEVRCRMLNVSQLTIPESRPTTVAGPD